MPQIELNKTYEYLSAAETKVVKQMQDILTKYNRNASRQLYESINMSLQRTQQGFLVKMEYAPHGQFVLDDRRNIRAPKPGYNKDNPKDINTTIGKLVQWITDKKISVGSGRVRTPLRKTADKGGKYDLEPKHTSYNKDKEVIGFAFAIWKNIKKRGRTWTGKTNFLKPYENLMQNKTFRLGLVKALSEDGVFILNKDIRGKLDTIKIKM